MMLYKISVTSVSALTVLLLLGPTITQAQAERPLAVSAPITLSSLTVAGTDPGDFAGQRTGQSAVDHLVGKRHIARRF